VDVTIPNPSNPSATPAPITRSVATPQTPAATVVGESAPEAAQRQVVDANTRAQLQEAVDAGVAGKKMLSLLDRLNTLADLAGASGSAQIPTWVDGWLRDHGLVITNRQGILAEMQAEFNAQIPELRKDMGVKFEAGPELSAQAKMIGNPSYPPAVLKGIFARQAAIAQMGVQKRDLAMRALYPDQPNRLSPADYYKQAAQIDDNVGAETAKQLKEFGGITPETLTPPPAPPSLTGGSALDAIRSGLHWLYGDTAPPQAQPPVPQPKATETWDVDANGRPVRVR
jgi:hypothetical protein